jgi:hypothetical protein
LFNDSAVSGAEDGFPQDGGKNAARHGDLDTDTISPPDASTGAPRI